MKKREQLDRDQIDNTEILLEESNHAREIKHLHLVLEAARIDSRIHHEGNVWQLVVSRHHYEQARNEVDEYLQEQGGVSANTISENASTQSLILSTCAYGMTLLAFMQLKSSLILGVAIESAGRMQAAELKAGQWWRCFTALTLHRDMGHLIGNLVMGSLFGWMVGRRIGTGTAWLTIVIAGGFGNCLSGLIRSAESYSLGASTAVFAALGILAAEATIHQFSAAESRLRRWLPMISATVLMAWTGTGGPQTDVLSHLTGFLSGIMLGLLILSIPHDAYHQNPFWQRNGGLITVGIVIVSWLLAMSQTTSV